MGTQILFSAADSRKAIELLKRGKAENILCNYAYCQNQFIDFKELYSSFSSIVITSGEYTIGKLDEYKKFFPEFAGFLKARESFFSYCLLPVTLAKALENETRQIIEIMGKERVIPVWEDNGGSESGFEVMVKKAKENNQVIAIRPFKKTLPYLRTLLFIAEKHKVKVLLLSGGSLEFINQLPLFQQSWGNWRRGASFGQTYFYDPLYNVLRVTEKFKNLEFFKVELIRMGVDWDLVEQGDADELAVINVMMTVRLQQALDATNYQDYWDSGVKIVDPVEVREKAVSFESINQAPLICDTCQVKQFCSYAESGSSCKIDFELPFIKVEDKKKSCEFLIGKLLERLNRTFYVEGVSGVLDQNTPKEAEKTLDIVAKLQEIGGISSLPSLPKKEGGGGSMIIGNMLGKKD